ncbi:MFS general substrate transporter [Gloeophyllum trabeum ATCC 11539]|uniref:MFS general substrate transporter n=1 Tax=Gloeophyllum trabeum (strain ATCC 11539 / FP-39264 / Madison 617) TaxID=670483 RepID=S7RZ06_GLOTA|nr:MFS general substrate transporter [Gloeophyllum trabeum ATCC 11539]EPQ58664.1 MFS general substrate transporter [Gloeophyllum trabeum ATCC 11539]
MIASEETPLISSAEDPVVQSETDDIFQRFTPGKKRAILALVSWSGLLPFFVTGSFVPTIPQIAEEFNSSGSVINLSVSFALLMLALGNLIWARYSSFYGRRPILVYSLPLLCFSALGVAIARSVPELILWRMLQAFAASAGMSVGAAVIGDIYRLEQRGTAMGVFFASCCLGPALAPFCGGLAAYYASWRAMQYALFISAGLAFLFMYAFLPETAHPGTTGLQHHLRDQGCCDLNWKWVWLNPLSSLRYIRSPNILAVTLACAFTLITDYVLLIPLSYTIGAHYHIKNEAIIGAFFLPAGLGNIVGSPLAGYMSDKIIVKWRVKRNGEWLPEDRLRAAIPGLLVLAPLSIIVSGLITENIPGLPGIILNLFCLFINGVGIDTVFSPCSAYFVDLLHSRSAEVMAASMGVRAAVLAVASACVLPLINMIGVATTNTIFACFAWIGFGCVLTY